MGSHASSVFTEEGQGAVYAMKEDQDYDIYEEHRNDDIYHIESWQRIRAIPSGRGDRRIHYIYDRTIDKAVLKDAYGRISVVTGKLILMQLNVRVMYPSRFYREGEFIRKLGQPELESNLFSLVRMMLGYEKTGQIHGENDETYNLRVRVPFEYVISTK